MSRTDDFTALRPIDDDTNTPPDPPECFSEVALVNLSATPPSVAPFGGPVELKWSVSVPAGCPTSLTLNNATVARSGSMTVQPAQTTTYTMVARSLGFSRTLGRVTVPVETSACITGSLDEADVRADLQASIDEVDAATSRLSQRRPATVEIDTQGIHVAVRMKIAIDNFADPDLDVDLVLGLRTRDGAAEVFYKSFSVDLDWPWWVTAISLGISKIVEEIVENEIEGKLKSELLAKAKEVLDEYAAGLPGNLKLYRIVTAQDRIDVTVCPAGPTIPHIVLGGGIVFDGGGAVFHRT